MPGRTDEASLTQPGRVLVRFQVIDSWDGTPRLSVPTRVLSPRAQSAESQTMRPADMTCTWSLAGPSSNVQAAGPVDTTYTSNRGSSPAL